MKAKKTIIFVTNPFGFGPTGKLYPIMQLMHDKFDFDLIYFHGDLTSQIINLDYLTYINVNERSEDDIYNHLINYKDGLVISSLNRFAINAAKRLGLPCVLIDGLTWLWDPIPKDFLLADKYYSLNFLGVQEKINENSNMKMVPYILDTQDLNKQLPRKNFVLMSIGGLQNPLYVSRGRHYLKLIIKFLNSLVTDKKIVIASDKDSLKYLEKNVQNNCVSFITANKAEFHKLLKTCSHLLTTSGLTTTLEAFYTKTPVSFLLPSNLSQYKILSLICDKSLAESCINWDIIFPIKEKIWQLDEHDALIYLDKLAKSVISDKNKISLYVSTMKSLFNDNANTGASYKFINSLGVNGAEVIVDDIKNNWNLL